MKAEYRWCLTGTPIQNSLDDFGALLAFIKVPPFEDQNGFDRYILEPVKKREHGSMQLLRKVVAATCLRRTKADNLQTLDLPVKDDRVEWVEMGSEDRRLYEFFKRFSYLSVAAAKTTKTKAATNILVLISMLRLICDHGEALLPESALTAWKHRDQKVLTWEMLEANTRRCDSCDRPLEDLDTSEAATESFKCDHVFCETCLTSEQGSANQPECPKCGIAALGSPSARSGSSPSPPLVKQEAPEKQKHPPSAKIEALLRNILEEKRVADEAHPTKRYALAQHLCVIRTPCGLTVTSVIFSLYVRMLNLIEASLRDKGLKIYRIDGQTSMPQRRKALEAFSSDGEFSIMLASIGAAGEGYAARSSSTFRNLLFPEPCQANLLVRIDLTAANTVHIVEPHWNPMAEAQAVDRVHRIGQQQTVKIVRYIVNDSIEKVSLQMRLASRGSTMVS